MKRYLVIICLMMSACLIYGQFSATEVSRTGDTPDLISFQGRIFDSIGNPVNGNLNVRFAVYGQETAGNILWQETRTVAVSEGLFQLYLGEETPLGESYFDAPTRYLGVKIGTDSEMTPRIRVSSVPYAMQANEGDPTWSGEANTTADIGRTGKVGIGTDSPLEHLHVNEGTFLVRGTYESAPQLNLTGPGTRMFYYPRRAAFRAGRVTGTQWDDNNIGNYSIAMGYNTKASGFYSTALGQESVASGFCSFALGWSALAEGSHSSAIGHSTTASGHHSTAIGRGTTASGYGSTTLGRFTTADGFSSVAIGDGTTASGDYSLAFGSLTTASGNYSTAMGRLAYASGENSFAINLSNVGNPAGVGERRFRISGALEIGGNTAWTNYSDRRLKREIENLEGEDNLAKIMRLNGVRFRREEYHELLNLGFIAQDIEEIVPESVRYDDLNDIYSMEYTALIPVLVEAMKEQQQQIEVLEQKVRELMEKID